MLQAGGDAGLRERDLAEGAVAEADEKRRGADLDDDGYDTGAGVSDGTRSATTTTAAAPSIISTSTGPCNRQYYDG